MSFHYLFERAQKKDYRKLMTGLAIGVGGGIMIITGGLNEEDLPARLSLKDINTGQYFVQLLRTGSLLKFARH